MSGWRRVRGLRPRLILVVAAGAAVVLTLLTVAFNFVLDVRLNASADDLLHQRAAAHLATLDTVDGHLRAREAPDEGAFDTPIWVFAGHRALERPAAPAAVQRAARVLAGGPRRSIEVPATDTRLYTVPVVAGGQRLGTLVAAASLAPYERTAHTALVASIGFAALVLLAIILAARWAIGAALRPVADITARAERASADDLEGRFATGEPYDEVTRLASTFDRLFSELAASLRRERTFTAEVSHELRTPLARLVAEADLALGRDRPPGEYRRAITAIRRTAGDMTRTLDALLAAAHADSDRTHRVSDAREAAAAAVRAVEAEARGRGITVTADLPATAVTVAADAAAVERIVAPLIDNGCRYAASTVQVAVRRVNGEVRLSVFDDGGGVEPSLRDRIFEPGVYGRAGDGERSGAGLGLALARRLARALDGDVDYVDGREGATFQARLPSL